MSALTRSIAAAVCLCTAAHAVAAERFVVVELRDGRYVSGDVDSNTDDKRLVLRSTTPSIVLRSSFEWTRVVQARDNDRVYTPAGLQRVARKLREAELKRKARKKEAPDKTPAMTRPSFTSLKTRPPEADVPPPPASGKRSRDVAFLRVEAHVANWDADAEFDGVIVRVFPQSIDGHILKVHGSLEVKLVGKTLAVGTTNWGRNLFPKIGQWSQQVRQSDFHRWGAAFRLPFQNVDPQLDLEVESTALLTARLSIPGKGTFSATDANVALRPYSRIRDESQLKRGTRIFPSEK